MLGLAVGALMSVLIFGAASAQTVPLTVTLPAGPVGTAAATVNGVACGTATTSTTAPTILVLAVGCQTPVSATGTLVLTQIGIVPAPAAPGFDMSAMQDERSGWPMILLALATVGGLVVADGVLRRRGH